MLGVCANPHMGVAKPTLPVFSWDTLPVFFHAASPTPWDASQIATLAKFPLITIEKYAGPFPLKPKHGVRTSQAHIGRKCDMM